MNEIIEAVLFDMGGTLRKTARRDEEDKKERIQRMQDLLGSHSDGADFYNLLRERQAAYKDWAEETLDELSQADLWVRWMLPDWPADQIANLATRLNLLWREANGIRNAIPETRPVLVELFRRGYRLGLVSNTSSPTEAPELIRDLGVAGCFETMVFSCLFGKRKPAPEILRAAAERMGVAPEHCAYVGDRLDRDVSAAKKAGFAKVVYIKAEYLPVEDPLLTPDHWIKNLKELLQIFDHAPRSGQKSEIPTWDASLSTMWGLKNFDCLEDFFLGARRLGFNRFELNHQVNPAMLAGIDLSKVQISGVHEPCPSDLTSDDLKFSDLLISSIDEACRKQAVEMIKRSIDLAHAVKAKVVVVHAGNVNVDNSMEKRLIALEDAGKLDAAEYIDLKELMVKTREAHAGPRFAAALRSLGELLEYAGRYPIRLGVENRSHLMDIPVPDEMETILGLAGPDRIGVTYDVGHAESLSHLGFFPADEWLKRFGQRIIETHLHDVIGHVDHFAPGLGRVDFAMISPYLPEDAVRVFELRAGNSTEQVKAGAQYLLKKGCIRRNL